MGRVKTAAVKKFSKVVFQKYADKFTSDFQENKKILEELAVVESKKIRNQVVGHITRLMKIASTVQTPEGEMEEAE